MSLSAIIDALVAAGATPQQLAAAVRASEHAESSAIEQRRANDRERKQRQRHGKSRDVAGQDVTSADILDPSPDKEAPQTPKEINPNQETNPDPEEGSIPSLANSIDLAVEAYNRSAEFCGWPSVQKMTDARRSALRNRLEDCGGLSGWSRALERASKSSLLTGANDRGWRADFDFFLKASKFTKLLEGSYDDHKPTGNRSNGSGANGQRSGADAVLAAGRRAYARAVDASRGASENGFDFASAAPTIDERGQELGSNYGREGYGSRNPESDTSSVLLFPTGRL